MKLLTFIFFFLALTLGAEVKICAHCGKGARHMRYSVENRHFCSDKCARAKFSCTLCGQIPKGRYMIFMGINGESRRYCGECSKFKKCFSCFLPAKAVRNFNDGRAQCMPCSRAALSPEATKELLRQLRSDLEKMYGYDTRHPIILRQVSKTALRKIANSDDAMGCMKVLVTTETRTSRFKKEERKKWQCTMYILDNLPPVAAAKVMTHELTHDYLYHHAGAGQNAKITEGICEAVSAKWLLSRKLNGVVEAMKKNPDPVYGTGFREAFPQLERYGIKGLLARYRTMFKPF